jgi:phage/plasmid-associated DNA primase
MRGIIGDYKCKKFMVCIGPTNSSKGMLQEFLHYIFSGYVGHFNGNSLVSRFNTEGTRDLGWFLPLADTRLCFGSEIKADKGSLINSEIVKQIVSGGETIVLRQLYKEEKPVVPRTMPILFCNEIPAFTSMNDAILNRVISIMYDHSFVEFPTKEYQRQAKPDLKSTLKSQNYANAFIQLMVCEFAKWKVSKFAELSLPESIKNFREEIIEIANIEEMLEDQFEITKNPDDFITNKELEAYFRDKGIDMSMIKASLMLKQVGVHTIVKEIGKKSVRIKKGIRRKPID